MTAVIPVIDLFAGPGGLGEGFSAYRTSAGKKKFRLALSIEKEFFAHQTLTLRAFYRQFDKVPNEYWSFQRRDLSKDELYLAYPRQAAAAYAEAQQLELGQATSNKINSAVKAALGAHDAWILIGGPPCQAYSIMGRSRNLGNSQYVAADDARQTLYLDYLQVLGDHGPPVFVMENVKGLLSATLNSQQMFSRIRADLCDPRAALRREGRRSEKGPRYRLCVLAAPTTLFPAQQPADFILRSEDFGVPQARHRVIIVGVRDDVATQPTRLVKSPGKTVRMTIGDLPRLRSGVTDYPDSAATWKEILTSVRSEPWYKKSPSEVQRVIRNTTTQLRLPQADRGGEFVQSRGHSKLETMSGVANHASRAHIASDLHRYLFASSFAEVFGHSPDLSYFPTELLPAHRNVKSALTGGNFADRFRVQLADRPSTTVTSHISKDGHYYIHYDPSQCRSLTVREAARLQTFPDDYVFCGPRTSQYQQVGNAVPPSLARQIAEAIAIIY